MLLLLFPFWLIAQQANIVGKVVDDATEEPISNVKLYLEETQLATTTDTDGTFTFAGKKLPLGEQVLVVEFDGYISKKYPLVINEGATLDLGILFLSVDIADEKFKIGIISLSDDEIGEGDGVAFNISGLLQSSRDVFLRAAAFDFSSTFFRPRGLDNANGKVLINGLEMNKQFSGRPQWANWGGLNDVANNREFSMYSKANENSFGDLAGTTNLVMRASQLRPGGRVSFASSDRTYEGRIMGSYNSGMLKGGWAYSVLLSRRYGEEGFREGTPYDANSAFLSVEKRINEDHSLNFTTFYAPNVRGIGTSITQEMRDLKGVAYNPNWGFQDGRLRNSRMRRTEEPVFMLNHYWDVNEKIKLNTNASYQVGRFGTTRINNGGTTLVDAGGRNAYLGGTVNPNPFYYQNLPSYYLRDPNPSSAQYQQAWYARDEFQNNGQFNWDMLYQTNLRGAGVDQTGWLGSLAESRNAAFILQEDRVDDTQIQFNSIIDAVINNNIQFNGSVNYRYLKSENFAEVADLMGGERFLDVDFFAEETSIAAGEVQDLAQSDVRNPNRHVVEGDRFNYNYEIEAEVYSTFAQFQFSYSKVDFYASGSLGQTKYQRTGLYQNGFFQDNSFGAGEQLDFLTYGLKGGALYKLTGRHLFEVNLARMQNAPTIQNTYVNARQNHDVVNGITEVIVNSADLSYIYRTPSIKARISGFYSTFENETNVGFYFTENITGLDPTQNNGNAFVQEVTSGINRRNMGIEYGIEYQVTPTINLKAAGSIGQYTFTNNPDLYLTGQDFPGREIRFGDGKSQMKDVRVSAGPQQAYQLGFEYRDPAFWNIGLTSNYFAGNYIGPSALLRSENFVQDFDGIPFNDYDEEQARRLLKQERFSDFMLFNLTGGKSWRVNFKGDRYFVGFFAVISNLFDQENITGGFEQSRRANFRNRSEDFARANGPLFGNRYFYGFGRTYYVNFYIRF